MNLDWLKQLDMPYDVLGDAGEIVIVNGDCLKALGFDDWAPIRTRTVCVGRMNGKKILQVRED